MKKTCPVAVAVAIAIAVLVATTAVSRAEEAGSAGVPDADCNRVIKALAASEKKPSSQQLASELNLPVEKVNACLLVVRHSGSGSAAKPAGGE